MSLLVDLRVTPWNIIHAVQARVLANRDRCCRRSERAYLNMTIQQQLDSIGPLNKCCPHGFVETLHVPDEPVGHAPNGYPVAYCFVSGDTTTIVHSTDGLASAEGAGPTPWTIDNSTSSVTLIPGHTWTMGGHPPITVSSLDYHDADVVVAVTTPSGTSDATASYDAEYLGAGNYYRQGIVEWTYDRTFTRGFEAFIQFPAGKKKSIFFRWKRDHKSQVQLIDRLGDDRLYYTDGGTYNVPAPGDPTTVYTHKIYAINYERTMGVNSISETQESSLIHSCFLVTDTTCREIPTPAALLAIMDGIAPARTKPAATYTTDAIYGNVYVDSVAWGEWMGWPDSTDLSKEYGGPFHFRAHPYANSSSPGVFKILRNHTASLAVNFNDLPASLAFLESEGPPTFQLRANQLTTEFIPTRVNFDLTNNPDVEDPEVPTYKRNKAGDVVFPPEMVPLAAFAAWDWGKPGYCQEQLLALGFTAEDLTP